MMRSLNLLLRTNLNLKNSIRNKTRRFNNTEGRFADYSGGKSFDQYAAHSPMQQSRHKIEELRSKIFFEHPPIPNRIPKFIFLFFIMATFSCGVRDRVFRRNKRFVKEEERRLFRLIVPFVQAMEDVRFTAIEQKEYMITKAISDLTQPGYFEKIRWRYHQEDIYVPQIRVLLRKGTQGSPTKYGQGLMGEVSWNPNTVFDKGLMDAREVGYIY